MGRLELKWRTLYLARCCRACLNRPGDYAVRRSKHDAPLCFLCSSCCKQNHVVRKLQREHATLDVTGLSGKILYTKNSCRFVSEVVAATI